MIYKIVTWIAYYYLVGILYYTMMVPEIFEEIYVTVLKSKHIDDDQLLESVTALLANLQIGELLANLMYLFPLLWPIIAVRATYLTFFHHHKETE